MAQKCLASHLMIGEYCDDFLVVGNRSIVLIILILFVFQKFDLGSRGDEILQHGLGICPFQMYREIINFQDMCICIKEKNTK